MKLMTTAGLELGQAVRIVPNGRQLVAKATVTGIVYDVMIYVRLASGSSHSLEQGFDGRWTDAVGNVYSVHI